MKNRFSIFLLFVLLVVISGYVKASSPEQQTDVSSQSEAASVAGTTWAGTDSAGDYIEYHFQADGALHYKTPTRFWKNGSWKQNKNVIYMEMNNKHTEYNGVIKSNRMEGNAWNIKGHRRTWEAFVVLTDNVGKGLKACKAEDWITAARLLIPLKEKSTPEVLVCLSGMYFAGKGVPQDFDESLRLMQLAAEIDKSGAHQYSLIMMLKVMYDNNLGTIRNQYSPSEIRLEAEKWMIRAAENCHQRALSTIIGTFARDENRLQDNRTKQYWREKLASCNN